MNVNPPKVSKETTWNAYGRYCRRANDGKAHALERSLSVKANRRGLSASLRFEVFHTVPPQSSPQAA
jgi:hypothetical protein